MCGWKEGLENERGVTAHLEHDCRGEECRLQQLQVGVHVEGHLAAALGRLLLGGLLLVPAGQRRKGRMGERQGTSGRGMQDGGPPPGPPPELQQ
jgi:hypothetical protein